MRPTFPGEQKRSIHSKGKTLLALVLRQDDNAPRRMNDCKLLYN